MTDRVQRRLLAIHADVEWLRLKLPGVLAVLARSGLDLGESVGPRGFGTGMGASPTEASAMRSMKAEADYRAIDAFSAIAKGAVAELLAAVNGVKDPDVDTARIAEQSRCLEDALVDEWADARCTRNAVRVVDIGAGREVPLCWAAIKRRDRWRAERSAAS